MFHCRPAVSIPIRLAAAIFLCLGSSAVCCTPPAHGAPYSPPSVTAPVESIPSSLTVPVVQTAPCLTAARSPHIEQHRNQVQFHPLVDARPVWPITRGAGQTVAIIDTGVNPHPRLPHLRGIGDFGDSRGLKDCDMHGSFVASIVGAAPQDDGFAGVAPDATILSLRQTSSHYGVIDPEERQMMMPGGRQGMRPGDHPHVAAHPRSTTPPGTVLSMATAVRMAADAGATIITIAQTACRPLGEPFGDESLGAALAYAVHSRDALVVASAGNLGQDCREQNEIMPLTDNPLDASSIRTVVSPAYFDDLVLTVGSVAADGRPSDFSVAGPWVDVVAPGEDLVVLGSEGMVDAVRTANGELSEIRGTSFAAPYVAGVAALVRAHHPEWSALRVMEHLKKRLVRYKQGEIRRWVTASLIPWLP